MLSIVNIFTPSINNWNGNIKWMKAILYFERIIEQNKNTRQHYNYGFLKENYREEIQTEYLVPLLKCQCYQHEDDVKDDNDAKYEEMSDKYIFKLFAHFCNSKKFIDLSCINIEIDRMCNDLKEILFDSIDIDNNIYEINESVFPYLKQYKYKLDKLYFD